MIRLRALQVAPAAQRLLRHARPLRVLQAYPHACNLSDADGRLLSLVSRRQQLGPFAIQVWPPPGEQGFAAWVSPGEAARIGTSLLGLGGMQIHWREASSWDPRPDWSSAQGGGWAAVHGRTLQAALRRYAPGEGLVGLLQPAAMQPGRMGRALLSAVEPAARQLCQGIAQGDWRAARQAAGRLAGRGPGLTPAGDDFLVGAMLALWASEGFLAASICRSLYRAVAGATNRLSRAWLGAAAEGQASQPWHELVQALAAGQAEPVGRAARRVIAVGHSSGADGLVGFSMLGRALWESKNRARLPNAVLKSTLQVAPA